MLVWGRGDEKVSDDHIRDTQNGRILERQSFHFFRWPLDCVLLRLALNSLLIAWRWRETIRFILIKAGKKVLERSKWIRLRTSMVVSRSLYRLACCSFSRRSTWFSLRQISLALLSRDAIGSNLVDDDSRTVLEDAKTCWWSVIRFSSLYSLVAFRILWFTFWTILKKRFPLFSGQVIVVVFSRFKTKSVFTCGRCAQRSVSAQNCFYLWK